MKDKVRAAVAVCLASSLVGCASTNENLQRESARAIGGNVAERQVSVSNVERGATSVKWKATTPNGNYECSADDMVRRVLCTKK
jgi:hypothetical protein